MKFINFLGNEKIKEQLTFLAESKRLPHAIILEGAEGIGKRTLARDIALNLFCRGEGEKPCLSCPQCSKVMKQLHPDIYEYTAPDRVRAFHVDKVRDIREDVYVRPNEADYKIYILGNAQSMSVSAQNALLKILEEPPAYAIFIMTVTSKSAMLETVLSRSVVFTLEGVNIAEAKDYILENNEEYDEKEVHRALEAWNGNIGKALESLSDGKLSKISALSNEVINALLSDNEYELIKACSAFSGDRETLVLSLTMLKSIFRDALVYPNGDIISGNTEAAKRLSSRLSKRKLLRLIETGENMRLLTLKNGNNAILITKLSYELKRAVER